LTDIFLESMFSFLRHNPWMILTEMFCRAGNRAFSCLAVRKDFLCRHIFMSWLQTISYLPRLDRLVRMVLGMGQQALRVALDIWS
jgi:hypothetical protein